MVKEIVITPLAPFPYAPWLPTWSETAFNLFFVAGVVPEHWVECSILKLKRAKIIVIFYIDKV